MGNSPSSPLTFPYEIKSLEYPSSSKFPWSLHSGAQKCDDSPVTLFKLSKDNIKHPCFYLGATHHFTKSNSLRHPYILRIIDTLDLNDYLKTNKNELVIVTEEVIPLKAYLESNERMGDNPENAILWGLYCIIQALKFIHENLGFSHGLLSMDSIYVTPEGDWKLSNFCLMTSIKAR